MFEKLSDSTMNNLKEKDFYSDINLTMCQISQVGFFWVS